MSIIHWCASLTVLHGLWIIFMNLSVHVTDLFINYIPQRTAQWLARLHASPAVMCGDLLPGRYLFSLTRDPRANQPNMGTRKFPGKRVACLILTIRPIWYRLVQKLTASTMYTISLMAWNGFLHFLHDIPQNTCTPLKIMVAIKQEHCYYLATFNLLSFMNYFLHILHNALTVSPCWQFPGCLLWPASAVSLSLQPESPWP